MEKWIKLFIGTLFISVIVLTLSTIVATIAIQKDRQTLSKDRSAIVYTCNNTHVLLSLVNKSITLTSAYIKNGYYAGLITKGIITESQYQDILNEQTLLKVQRSRLISDFACQAIKP